MKSFSHKIKDPKKETTMDARKKMPKRYEKDTKKDAKRAKKDMKKRWHHQKYSIQRYCF